MNSSTFSSRPVRRLLWRLLWFSAGLACCFGAGELASRQMYAVHSDLDLQLRYLEADASEIEVLALGTSHIAQGFDPSHLSTRGFNLAFSAQDLYYDVRLFLENADRLPKLSTLIVSLDWFSLGYDEARVSPHMVLDYGRSAGIPPRNAWDFGVLASRSILVQHRKAFLKDFVQGKQPAEFTFIDAGAGLRAEAGLLRTGYLMGGEGNYKENGLSRASFHSRECYDPELVPENLQLLQQMVDSARDRGIRVLMITPPYTRSYREAFDSGIRTSFYTRVHQFLEGTNPKNVQYADYSSFDLPQSNFKNSDHLNAAGAARFTKMLDAELSRWHPPASLAGALAEVDLAPKR